MNIDWFSSMKQVFTYFEVDPGTWKDVRRLMYIMDAPTIKRDKTTDTIETASFKTSEQFKECYIRVYLNVTQNGIEFPRISFGTFLVQTPSGSTDGKLLTTNLDAYSPLLELKDVFPDIGFTIPKNHNILDSVYELVRNATRAPVVPASDGTLISSDFTAESDENMLDYTKALLAAAKFEFSLDEYGRILFSPIQLVSSMQPVFTFNNDNSSILYPDATNDFDLYGVPNVVQVSFTDTQNGINFYYEAVNDDPGSPSSIPVRGRRVVHREINPTLTGTPTQAFIEQYAKQLLESLSTIDHTISYSHGYCPVRVGDCVRLNYNKAYLKNIKAKVTSQSIECKAGCVVDETATYTVNLLEVI